MKKRRMKAIRSELNQLEIDAIETADQRDLGTIIHLLNNIIFRNFLE